MTDVHSPNTPDEVNENGTQSDPIELTVSAGSAGQVSSLRMIVTLTIAAMLSGLALAGAYQITKPIIEANEAAALERAVFNVVPNAAKLQKFIVQENRLTLVASDEKTSEPIIIGAYADDGTFLGYAIKGKGPGFQDTITLLYGYNPATKRVIGMEVLDSLETPGLGDKIRKDETFVAIFSDLAVEPEIKVIKKGKRKENEVDAISGATISSVAVVKIINEANEDWLPQLPPPGSEPEYVEPPRQETTDEDDQTEQKGGG